MKSHDVELEKSKTKDDVLKVQDGKHDCYCKSVLRIFFGRGKEGGLR